MPQRPISEVVLICGVTGQDGAYLAKNLLGRGHAVWGSSRDIESASLEGLVSLGVLERVQLLSLNLLDPAAIHRVLTTVRPQQIFNVSGQTSVGLSFEKPLETMDSIATAALNLLEGVRLAGLSSRLYFAGSAEMFGDTGGAIAHEETPVRPQSPYGVAKATAFWMASTYRQAYGVFACTAILSTHDSPLRSYRFVTRKIVNAVAQLATGRDVKLNLGNLQVERDWGWAPDYAEASVLMLEQAEPADYVIATGETSSLLDFMQTAFSLSGFDWRDHVTIDETLKRPSDVASFRLDPAKASSQLNWRARYRMQDVVRMMLDAEIKSLQR